MQKNPGKDTKVTQILTEIMEMLKAPVESKNILTWCSEVRINNRIRSLSCCRKMAKFGFCSFWGFTLPEWICWNWCFECPIHYTNGKEKFLCILLVLRQQCHNELVLGKLGPGQSGPGQLGPGAWLTDCPGPNCQEPNLPKTLLGRGLVKKPSITLLWLVLKFSFSLKCFKNSSI